MLSNALIMLNNELKRSISCKKKYIDFYDNM